MKDFLLALFSNWNGFVLAAMAVIAGLAALLSSLYALFLLIPGEQPDKAIKAVLDFTQKWSSKPSNDKQL